MSRPDPTTRPVAVALGSNVGDRAAHIAYGLSRLRQLLKDLRHSRNFDTEPVGVARQGRFLNAAAVGYSSLPALDLLDFLLKVERERGRERPFPGSPRTLDLDLLLAGDEVQETDALVLPHPRFRERLFVLEPLAEIAPEMKDPVTGETVLTLLEKLRQQSQD